MDARHSFPSGHASMSFTVGAFIALYMLGKLQPGMPHPVSLRVGCCGCSNVVKLDFTDLLCVGAMLPMGECKCECECESVRPTKLKDDHKWTIYAGPHLDTHSHRPRFHLLSRRRAHRVYAYH